MGVKGLYSYVKPYRSHVDYSSIPHGSKIGIDALSILYQYRGDIDQIMSILLRLKAAGCKILFIFDGPAPETKATELEERRHKRDEARTQASSIREFLQTATVLDRRSRDVLERRVAQIELGSGWSLTTERRKAIQEILWKSGFHSVRATGEADDLLVSLWKRGVLYGIVSTDMDFLVHGVNRLWVPCFSEKPEIQEICLEEILKKEDLSIKQFVEASILCSAVSSHAAFQWIRYYGSLTLLFTLQPAICTISKETISLKLEQYSKDEEQPLLLVKEKHTSYLEKFIQS